MGFFHFFRLVLIKYNLVSLDLPFQIFGLRYLILCPSPIVGKILGIPLYFFSFDFIDLAYHSIILSLPLFGSLSSVLYNHLHWEPA